MSEATTAGPDDDGMTPAQRKQEAKRLERAQQDVPAGDAGEAPKTEAVPLAVMLSEGPDVLIGERAYEVAAFPLAKLSQAGKLLALVPDMLTTAALSAHGGAVTAQSVTEVTNRLMKQADVDAPALEGEIVGYALDTMALNINDDEAGAMTDLVVLALSRRHPDVTAQTIADDLDIETFFQVLCRIFQANKPLRTRF